MAQLQTAAELLRRLGAVPPETALRLLVEACEALEPLGPSCTVTLESLRVAEQPGEHAEVVPAPFSTLPANLARAQVRAVAAVGYELLRGMPPPAAPDPSAWLGVRPELVAVLAPALDGTGPGGVAELAHQLRTLARPGTAEYAPAVAGPPLALGDTVIAPRSSPGLPDKHVGQLLGTWELVRRLGAGGMGDVYQARHVKLGREAAIKLLKPEYANDPEIVRRFFDEARVVNEINHPNIVEIFDFVEEPGRVYCVMELLQGQSLADLIARHGPLRPLRVANIFAQVCDALEAAHRRGVVHRDVKPDNIFLSTDAAGLDFARVLDFGVARRLSGDGKTQQGLVLGTLYFMAPEQAAGRQVDARADLYAVGVSMVEAITGRSPQEGHTGVPKETPRGEPLHLALVALLTKCLALDPVGRPRTAAEVRDALRVLASPFAPERPTTAALEHAAGVGKAASKPRRWAVAAGTALVLAAAAGLFFERGALFGPAAQPGAMVVAPPPVTEPTPAPSPAPAAAPAPAPVAPPATPALEPKVATAPGRKEPHHALKRGNGLHGHEEVAAPPPPAEHPFAERAATVQRRYDELVRRYGEGQLTTLERAAVRQALDDAHAGQDTRLAKSLPPAEDALEAASRRLSQ